MARNALGALLALLAVVNCLVGLALGWVNHVAHDPQPTAEIAKILVRDPRITDAISTRVVELVNDRLDDQPGVDEQTRDRVATEVRNGVAAALQDTSLDATWIRVLDATRAQAVSDLESWTTGSPAPKVSVEVAPILRAVVDKLKADGGTAAQIAAGIEPPSSFTLDGTIPEPFQEVLAPLLAQSRNWVWVCAGSAVLLALAVAAARRTGRGGILIFSGVLLLVLTVAVQILTTLLPFDQGDDTTASAAANAALQSFFATFRSALQPGIYIGVALLLVGITWAILAARARADASYRGKPLFPDQPA